MSHFCLPIHPTGMLYAHAPPRLECNAQPTLKRKKMCIQAASKAQPNAVQAPWHHIMQA